MFRNHARWWGRSRQRDANSAQPAVEHSQQPGGEEPRAGILTTVISMKCAPIGFAALVCSLTPLAWGQPRREPPSVGVEQVVERDLTPKRHS